MRYFLFIIAALAALWFYHNQNKNSRELNFGKENLSPKQIVLIENLENEPTGKAAKELNIEYLQETDPDTKQFLVRLISLNLIAADGNAFRKFKMSVERVEPDGNYFNFMEEDFPSVCSSCNGKGGAPCSKCKGEGKCTNIKCDGGRIRYESFDKKIEDRECVVCKGKGICQSCSGTKIADSSCKSCGGSGRKGAQAIAEKLYKETVKSLKQK